MMNFVRKMASWSAMFCLLALSALAQTGAISGKVMGEDGKGLQGALIRIDRTDIKGKYEVKTNKKGEFFHAGLPLGQYAVTLLVDGAEKDSVKGVRTTLGDPTPVNFDMAAMKARAVAMQQAAETGTLTKEQERGMSKEEKEALDKAMKERGEAMKKNKALNDAFNGGMEAFKAQNYPAAIESFNKAAELDAKQHVIWGQLAESYNSLSKTQTGADQEASLTKTYEMYQKAIELKPDDASYYNNYALALARGKKFTEAEGALDKASQIDPAGAGKYFYNLGAVLTNAGQLEPAANAFKKAITADPNYADAQYQYGISLTSKAQVKADGTTIFPEGTKEAFEKYLELKPDGPNAESAKGMLQMMGVKLQTTYKNPNAPASAPSTKTGKKK
jgi:tetratricopeptide (TPR) repeat protein